MTVPFSRTVTLPVIPGSSWDDFAWDPKYPGDELTYLLDATDWLEGGVILSVAYGATGATIMSQSFLTMNNRQTGIILTISGGTAGTMAQVGLSLTLTDGEVQDVLIALPIRAGLPAGLAFTGEGGSDDEALLLIL